MINIRLFRPIILMLAVLTYFLGAGIARYLGSLVLWHILFLGLLAVLPILAASFILDDYFDLQKKIIDPGESRIIRENYRRQLLQISFACLTFSGAIVVTLILVDSLHWQAGVLLAIITILLVGYSIPPFSLSRHGYGELVLAIILASLLPAFSFFLQENEFHRLVPIITFPLTLLFLAWQLTYNFSTYASDLKKNRQSLLSRLTWQRSVSIHHFLILTGYLLIAISPLAGVSWGLIWPFFLALPFASLQIFWLQRIANGGVPFWRFFTILAPSVLGLSVYLLGLSLWLR